MRSAGERAGWPLPSRCGVLRHDGQPHAFSSLRNGELQICTWLQRHFRQHVERKSGDQDAREIFAHGQHARIDHRARLQHELGCRL
jgi:hypothetical protein